MASGRSSFLRLTCHLECGGGQSETSMYMALWYAERDIKGQTKRLFTTSSITSDDRDI